MVHDFSQQFSSQSGVRLLQQFTFQQRKTKIAQVRACHCTKIAQVRTCVCVTVAYSAILMTSCQ